MMSVEVDMLQGLDFTHIVVLICDPRSVEIWRLNPQWR